MDDVLVDARGLHPVFENFRRWEGWAEPHTLVNWLGVRERATYYSLFYERFKDAHTRRYVRPPASCTPLDEEYFEWIDLLESVLEAQGRFTMIELGAGYGRWIVNATAALKQARPGLPYLLIAVEAEPQHFEWLQQHLRDNDVDVDSVRLVNAAVATVDGRGRFQIGDAYDCYGQALLAAERDSDGSDDDSEWNVRTVSLATLLDDLEYVDLIDADIQGTEDDVFDAGAEAVDEKVKRVHIETHNPVVEKRLRVVFGELGWRKLWDFPAMSETETPYGVIEFSGGVQTWLNPRFSS